jgi:transposase InsO family protein
MEQKLKAIYYDPKHPAGFSSIAKLAKASGYSNVRVKKWLKAQPTYTLHRQARKRYRTRKYIVHDIDEQWQADLADVALIAKENDGYRFILTVIDIFSRFAWARPLKTKSGKDVEEAFKDIFQEGRIPKRIQTDQGKEFENRHVLALFNQHNIELFSVKSAFKAAIVERFNRTLKHKLWRYFTTNIKQRWTHVLQDVVHSYNNSVHRTLGRKPADVSSENVSEIREKVFKHRKKSEVKGDIKIGDKVRISKVKSIFAKGYLPNWTEEIFTVDDINRKTSPTSYKLKDYQGEVIEGSFYREEIEPVIHEHDEYVVEKVLRTQKRGNEKWCLVKWLGYPSSMNSWVRKTDVTTLSTRTHV